MAFFAGAWLVDDMVRRIGRRPVLASLGGIALAGCISDDANDEPTPTPPTPSPGDWTDFDAFERPAIDLELPSDDPTLDVTVEPVAEGLEIPWDLDFDDEGDIYLTERTGQVLRFSADDLEAVLEPEDAIDAEAADDGWWVQGGEGGTMGIAVDGDDLFVYYTANDGGLHNRIVRYDRTDSEANGEVIVDDIPAANVHNGGRLAIGPDGYLWATTGDADDVSLSRDPDSLAGKVLRIDAEGEAASDNPDHGGDPRIVTGGHRNVQGIDWLDDDLAVITEHGPTARDEVAFVYPGGDYGWPTVRAAPDDDEYESYADHPSVVPPIVHTGRGTTWAPSGACFYTGEAIPSWQHRLLVAGLVSQRLYVCTLTPPNGELPPGDDATVYDDAYLDDGVTVTVHEVLHQEIGRIRHVAQGPNDEVYALTSNRDGRAGDDFPIDEDDRLVRIVQK